MNLKIFAGRSNEPLVEEIADYIGKNKRLHMRGERTVLGKLDDKRDHPDGELYVRYGENLRGSDVFIVQSTNQPHDNIQELEIMVDTARGSSAERVTAVIPYFGYARQDRKDKSRAPVSAITQVKKLVALGTNRFLVLDVHSAAVENAAWTLNVPCDHLWARPVSVKHIRSNPEFLEFMKEGFVVAGPDLNAGKFARRYAEDLGSKFPIALIEKRRDPSSGETETLNVIGNVREKNVLIADDMIDSGGSTGDAVVAFKKRGAKRIFALASHGVFLGERGEISDKLLNSPVEKILVTNSIARECYPPKVEVISVAELLGEAIFRIHTNGSLSSLFE